MPSWARRLLKRLHPEGIPGPCAAFYDRLARSRGFQQQYQLVVADLIGHCSAGRLLDVGTGPGWLLVKLRERAPQLQLTGVDISPAMVARARRNLARAGAAEAVEIREASVSRLPFPDDGFDMVVSTGSLHHWKEPVAGLDELRRVLKPGGVALVYDLVRKLPPAAAAEAARELGRVRFWLLWLHSFEEPFFAAADMERLAGDSQFGAGSTRFVGVFCGLVLRKPPA